MLSKPTIPPPPHHHLHFHRRAHHAKPRTAQNDQPHPALAAGEALGVGVLFPFVIFMIQDFGVEEVRAALGRCVVCRHTHEVNKIVAPPNARMEPISLEFQSSQP